jgi:hypothetical protein
MSVIFQSRLLCESILRISSFFHRFSLLIFQNTQLDLPFSRHFRFRDVFFKFHWSLHLQAQGLRQIHEHPAFSTDVERRIKKASIKGFCSDIHRLVELFEVRGKWIQQLHISEFSFDDNLVFMKFLNAVPLVKKITLFDVVAKSVIPTGNNPMPELKFLKTLKLSAFASQRFKEFLQKLMSSLAEIQNYLNSP